MEPQFGGNGNTIDGLIIVSLSLSSFLCLKITMRFPSAYLSGKWKMSALKVGNYGGETRMTFSCCVYVKPHHISEGYLSNNCIYYSGDNDAATTVCVAVSCCTVSVASLLSQSFSNV